MKWAVVVLCLLGSVAAASAALLVHALRVPNSSVPTGTGDVTVLIAKRTLPAMTVIDSSVVEVQTLAADKAPANFISSPVSVVGKVLNRPVVEGQAFTTACFADLVSAQQLAGVIPNGKRAVGISVTNYAGMNGLLYPGSMVDVMVSMKKDDQTAEGARRDAFTTTLLENVQVLAIEQQSVISQSRIANPVDAGRANESHCVTLLVDSKQAKALQLAMEQGTLSLALRNPLDAADADRDAFYAQSLMGNGVQRGQGASRATPEIPSAGPRWEMTIMRGGAVETKSFPMPESN